MPNIKELLKDPENTTFTPEMMRLAIADKKIRRKKKGLEFNCFVIDRSSSSGMN